MRKVFRILIGVLFLFAPGSALGQDDPKPDRPKVEAVAGPIEFHVIPEIGAGLLLRSDQTIQFSAGDAFALVRIPGLRFPDWNKTTTGIQVEFSQTPGTAAGVRYDIVSYTRTKIAGPAYTGANIRIAQGTTDLGAEFSARVMPVVGLHLWTVSGHVPFNLEIEFLDNNRPIKAVMIVTWQ